MESFIIFLFASVRLSIPLCSFSTGIRIRPATTRTETNWAVYIKIRKLQPGNKNAAAAVSGPVTRRRERAPHGEIWKNEIFRSMKQSNVECAPAIIHCS